MTDILTHPAFLITVGSLLGSGVIFWIISCVVAGYFSYTCTLKRKGNEHWSREMPSDLTDQSKQMYQCGLAWAEEYNAYKKDVHIIRDGLNLYGEYYDFGKKRCAVILSGRTESLRYGYYFAIPYAANDCNILVLDPRAHGMSDGEFNTVGFEESKDILAWVRFMKENFPIESFVFHGICIGAAGGMFALTSPDCPDYIEGIVTEGMFPNFGESFKNHMIEQKRPIILTFSCADLWMQHYTGHSMKYGPINVIEKLNKPLLMLHSKEDLYSTPEYAQKLYNLAGCKQKELVWFEHGKHSMLRITDTNLYDSSIRNFLNKIQSK